MKTETHAHLTRGFGLLHATALNMSNMVGAGPFITIPLLMASMGGPQSVLGWLTGALIVISDGLIWSELGAALPGSGGSYHFLREAYGNQSWGRLMAFLFIWQFVLIVVTGFPHFNAHRAFDFPPGALAFNRGFVLGLGSATLIAVYNYLGYYDVCYIGDEVRNPSYAVPRSILYSLAICCVGYFALHLALIGVVPWREGIHSNFIVSDFMERLYGRGGAIAVTILILWSAFGCVFALLLGYSRIPYAAAIGQAQFPKVTQRRQSDESSEQIISDELFFAELEPGRKRSRRSKNH